MPEAQILKSKEYETIYILRSDVDADTADKVQGRVAEVVGRDNGKLVKVESWGRRKLAYPVGKQKKGVYIYVKYVGRGGLVQELERNLKLQDTVLKFQTVLTNEEVDVQSVTVDPEEVKFQRLELPAEEEEKESREKALGLVDFGDGPRSMRGDRSEDDYGDAGDGAETASTAPAAAPAGDNAAAPAKEGGDEEA
ncbi:MAG: 30S ribosomal protein S6 [Labilithrix sp.]|nr:30S ribosomal protein S6 [Labilithrix sp.]MCW5833336.1 30S ribosomal protein S6 [Labilithrix sp.]